MLKLAPTHVGNPKANTDAAPKGRIGVYLKTEDSGLTSPPS